MNHHDLKWPIRIESYGGYLTPEFFYLHGRIIRDRAINRDEDSRGLSNIIHFIKAMETDEVPGIEVRINILKRGYTVSTDEEGYFTLAADHSERPYPDHDQIEYEVKCGNERVEDHLHVVNDNASIAIISDLDDTLLRTGVDSFAKLRMLYNSILVHPTRRKVFKQASSLISNLEAYTAQSNPVFYVSNAPWNLYGDILHILSLNDFPEGAIILRDYGFHIFKPMKTEDTSKFNRIDFLLKKVNLPFVLIGDAVEKDAEIYRAIARKHPGRVRAIYLRRSKKQFKNERVGDLLLHTCNTLLFDQADEAWEHYQSIVE